MFEELNTIATFDELIKKADDIQSRCSDEIIAANALRMDDDLKLNGTSLSGFAQGELCGKLHIPGRYFSHMVGAKQNHLAAENVNTWLADDARKLMLRKYDGHIRGVMSSSYSKYDAPDILRSTRDVFGDKNFELKSSFINEERLHIRFIENEMLPIEGEDLFAGISIDSSDVGRSGLYASFLIYKQVCTNGLKLVKGSSKIFRQKHIGITSEDFKHDLEEGFASFDTIKNGAIETVEETRRIPLPKDLNKMQEDIKKRTLLSDDDVTEVFDLLPRYGNNRWGLINGITEVAQKFTLETRLRLEEAAGMMLA